MMKVPFADLKSQYRSIKEEINFAIQDVINRSAFVRGEFVEKFEEEYAKAYSIANCVSCGNGTDALYIALKALDIGIGDEVITTSLSWISTSETITQTGARVVFADIESDFFTIDPNSMESKISEKTKAIIVVHLYGQPADMDSIMEIADRHGLAVIEDCAQAHFSRYKGQLVGTFGVAGTFSFYPGKNLGAYGDAGAIISNDMQFSRRARLFANHGSTSKHQHEIEGINSRMDGLQAAILSVKFSHLAEWTKRRRALGVLYDSLLKHFSGLNIPRVRDECDHVYHLYVIRSSQRDHLKSGLNDIGIETKIHYPIALPFLDAYKYLDHTHDDFPVAFEQQDKILSLPMYAELTHQMCKSVVTEIERVST